MLYNEVKILNYTNNGLILTLILKIFLYQMDIQMIIFERKILCVIAGTRTTDLQFSVLAP